MVISWAFCRNLKQPKKTNKKTGTQKLRIIEKEYDLPVRFHLRLKKRCQIISTLNDLRKRKLGETFLVFLKNLNLVRNLRKKKTANLPLWSQESPWLPAFFPSWRPYWLLQTFGAPGQCSESCWDFNGTDPTLFFSWNGSYAFFLFNKVLAKRCFGIVLSIWKFKHISFNCGRKQLGFLSHWTFRSKKED